MTDEGVREELRQTAARFLDARAPRTGLAARSDAPTTELDRSLWREIASLGWTGLGLAESQGGATLDLAERVVLFEEFGRSLAPLPLFSGVALVTPAVRWDDELARRVADGSSVVTLAWAEEFSMLTSLDAATTAHHVDDAVTLDGVKVRVPDLDFADEIVVSAHGPDGLALYVVCGDARGVVRSAEPFLDGTRRTGMLTLCAAPARPLVDAAHASRVLAATAREASVALCFEALGVAGTVLADAADYAANREQFGRAIGSFQAVAGPLADRYVALELARALAQWAARACDLDEGADVAVAAAKAACADAAIRTCEVAIQVAGAIGFTWEHHYHRYLRRALWIDAFEGRASSQRTRVAAALLDERRTPRSVELYDDEEAAAFRSSVRSWIDEHLPTTARGLDLVSPLDVYEDVKGRWRIAMVEADLLEAHWPVELGGRGESALHTAIFREEAIRAHPRVSHGDGGSDLVAPLLMEYGTLDQQRRFLDAIRLETEFWAQGFSEPNSGSDLASLATRADPEGEDWILNGQKTWSTYAPVAEWLFVLARTDPEASRHRGITCFIVNARAPGVEIRPIRDIAGTDEFGEIFFTDVRVPANDVLGPVNQGWSVAVMTLAIERVIESCEDIGELDFQMDRLLDCLSDWCPESESYRLDGEVRQRVAGLWSNLQAVRLVQYRCLRALETSPVPPPESEILKLAWSEVSQQVARLAVDLFGPLANTSERATTVARFWEFWYMMSRSVTIYAGTSEILRSVIAERILGLPRSR
ncbi:MAG TPA: acyl-CoA dehydrogenase [Candidatus Saccharimonadales bacterium]|nr:acyl-CoA dehydrogenase [Candidatus Saccharimonadales bacterium]